MPKIYPLQGTTDDNVITLPSSKIKGMQKGCAI